MIASRAPAMRGTRGLPCVSFEPMRRRFLFFFLALLLVARGLLGDAMALGMGKPASAAPAVAAAHADHAADAAPVPQAQRQHRAGDAATSDCASGQAHGSAACAACGLCHAAGPLAAPLALGGPAALTASAPAAHSERFASAPAARAIRPPIA